ncbi:MAG: ATP-binding protein [Candidatus Omnitrophica bacterium]|nr:ATP-binding protein [Candidatus Omnitrophota bacterium]
MIISVASGKGGTGKTTVAVSLALSLQDVQFLDCDVEEPNAHIFLKPRMVCQEKVFISVPEIDRSKCTYCGKCREVCAYHAIAVLPSGDGKEGDILIFSHLCHGCGACRQFCPQGAIQEVNKEIGVIETGDKDGMQFIHGRLNIGEAMSPPIIRQVKQHVNAAKTVIIDAPPGTSCPVVAAVKGSNFCILVTEPTPFGLNDLILAAGVLKKMQIPCGVVINRSDLGNDRTEAYCRQENIPILMRIPFKKEIAMAYSKGEPLVKAFPTFKRDFQGAFKAISQEKLS